LDIAKQLRDRAETLYRRGGGRRDEQGRWDCFHTEGNLMERAANEIERLRVLHNSTPVT